MFEPPRRKRRGVYAARILTVLGEELAHSSSSENDACLRRGRVTKSELGRQIYSSRGTPVDSLDRIEPQSESLQATNDLRWTSRHTFKCRW